MVLFRFVAHAALWWAVVAGAQVGGDAHVADAKREYAAVFAHPEQPCTWHDNASYEDCMGKELQFTEGHLEHFVATLRSLAAEWDKDSDPGRRRLLDGLNKTDLSWREFRKNTCALQFDAFQGGTGGGPAEQECELRMDRSYMKLLADLFTLQQMA